MMAQYWAVRTRFPGFLVLFQMGQFLEAFFDDAAVLSDTVGVALTHRGSHLGRPIPMAGVPLHTKDVYVARLVRAGFRVALCEQLDASGGPAAGRGAGAPAAGLMRRDVTRVVTAGTVTEDALLTPSAHNYLAAVALRPSLTAASSLGSASAAHGAPAQRELEPVGLAWLDLSTGDFYTRESSVTALAADLAQFPPAELLAGGSADAWLPGGAAAASGCPLLARLSTLWVCEQRLRVDAAVAVAAASGGAPIVAGGMDGGALGSPPPSSSRRVVVPRPPPPVDLASHPSLRPRRAPRVEVPGLDGDVHVAFPPSLAATATGEAGPTAAVGRIADGDVPGGERLSVLERDAASALLRYVRWTQGGARASVRPPFSLSRGSGGGGGCGAPAFDVTSDAAAAGDAVEADAGGHPYAAATSAAAAAWDAPAGGWPRLVIDPVARRALELTRPAHGRRRARGSLLHTLDACATAMGSRLLDARLCAPLAAAAPIRARLDGVCFLLARPALRESVRAALARMPDMERAAQRVAMAQAGAGGAVRDLCAVRDGLSLSRALGVLLATGDDVRYHPRRADAVDDDGGGGDGDADAIAAAAANAAADVLAAGGLPRATPAAHAAAVAAAARGDFDVGRAAPSPDATCSAPALSLARESAVLLRATAALLLPLRRAAATAATDAVGGSCGGDAHALAHAHSLLVAALYGGPSGGGGGGGGGVPGTSTVDVDGDASAVAVRPAAAARRAPASATPANTSWGPGAGAAGIVRAGFDAELDAARALRDDASAEVAALQEALREQTGVKALRVRRTDEHGLVAEVPPRAAAALAALPPAAGGGFTLIRSLKTASRYRCGALGRLDAAITEASFRASALEDRVLRSLAAAVASAAPLVAAVARAVAVVDVSAALAELAQRHQLVRPDIVDDDEGGDGGDAAAGGAVRAELTLRAARHLVVERALTEGWADGGGRDGSDAVYDGDGGGGGDAAPPDWPPAVGGGEYVDRTLPATPAPPRAFVPNDVQLGGAAPSCLLLTGPNMNGKSTALRSVAQLVVMSHMGSCVPAAAARLAVVDRLFARVGASDDVTRDRSTFLMEMEETAAILAHATRRSLVVVDEVGRGTAAGDGLAIAWAVLEHLATAVRCRTLFATHVHELAAMAVAPQLAAAARGAPPPPRGAIRCVAMAVEGAIGDDRGGGPGPVLTHRLVSHPVYAAVDALATAAVAGRVGGDADARGAVVAAWRRVGAASYGVHVAGLAGLPAPVLRRARGVLSALENSGATAAWVDAALSATSATSPEGPGATAADATRSAP